MKKISFLIFHSVLVLPNDYMVVTELRRDENAGGSGWEGKVDGGEGTVFELSKE